VIGKNARRPSAQRSLFSAVQGKRALFLNHGEDSGAPERGLEISKLLPDEFRGSLHRIIAGTCIRIQFALIKYIVFKWLFVKIL